MLNKGFIFSCFGLMMLFFFGSRCAIDLSRLLPEQTMDPIPPIMTPRTISQNVEKKLTWRKDQINIRRHLAPSPGLLAGHGYIAFVNFIGGPLRRINQLELLETTSGTTVWQSERFGDHEDIAIGKDRAVVLLRWGSLLNVYDISGDSKPLISLNNFKKAAAEFHLFPQVVGGNEVYLYYQQSNNYFLHAIDLAGTEVATPQKIKTIEPSSLFLFDQTFFLVTQREYIWGNFTTGEELWRIPVQGRVDSWPVLQDGLLIISVGDGKRYALMAIDTKNGHELWKSEETFGSNVVLHKGSLYALRNDATLVKLALTTGEIEEEISFNPSSIDAGGSAYWLASDGERLFVYFGDSQELFALNIP